MDLQALAPAGADSVMRLVNYYRILNPNDAIDDNISFHEMFFKVHGITYDHYLKNEKELDDNIDKLNYEEIPQRKLILKKNNIKYVKGIFLQNLNTFQTIVKSKKGKQIILLNFLIREASASQYLTDVFCYEGTKVGRNSNNDLIVSFSKEIPISFEVHYFTIKVKEDEPLQVFQETINQINHLTPKMYEITEKTKRNLNI